MTLVHLIEGKIERKDLFIVTKLPMMALRPERVNEYCQYSLKNLGLDYVDLYLIHTPIGLHRDEKTKFIKLYDGGKVIYDKDTDLVGVWREMERLVRSSTNQGYR